MSHPCAAHASTAGPLTARFGTPAVATVVALCACLGVVNVGGLAAEEPGATSSTRSDAVIMCIDPDWAPYEELMADGSYVGIAPDLLDIIFGAIETEWQVLPTASWDETLERARAGECDALSFLNQTAERDEWLLFTDPYFTDPTVIVARNEHPYVVDLAAFEGERVAVPGGTSIAERLRRDYPELEIVTVASEREAFALVDSGEVAMAVRSLTVAAYTIRDGGWFNLRIVGEIPEYRNELRIGVLRDRPEIRDRLNAGVAAVTPRDVNDAINRHISIEVGYRIDWWVVAQVAVVALVVVGGAVVWVVRERRHSADVDSINAQLRLVQEGLRESERRYRLLVESAREGIAVIQDGRVAFANGAFADLLRTTSASLLATESIAPLIAPEDRSVALENHRRRVAGESLPDRYEMTLQRADGSLVPVEVSGVPILWNELPAALNFFVDISARKAAEERIHHFALHDPLTALPNRTLFFDRLDQALAAATRQSSSFALLFLDLNRFKPINDNFGHAVGDAVLIECARRLEQCVRSSDTVARVGGDEFVVLLPSVGRRSDALEIAGKLASAVAQSIAVGELEVSVGASIGAAIFPEDGADAEALMHHADVAMYEVKRGPAPGPAPGPDPAPQNLTGGDSHP